MTQRRKADKKKKKKKKKKQTEGVTSTSNKTHTAMVAAKNPQKTICALERCKLILNKPKA
jgi:hypothetical protein